MLTSVPMKIKDVLKSAFLTRPSEKKAKQSEIYTRFRRALRSHINARKDVGEAADKEMEAAANLDHLRSICDHTTPSGKSAIVNIKNSFGPGYPVSCSVCGTCFESIEAAEESSAQKQAEREPPQDIPVDRPSHTTHDGYKVVHREKARLGKVAKGR